MAAYDNMTPGSAVSDVVQQILKRRRDDERQTLLDTLGVEKYKTDVSNQDRQFGLDKARNDSQLALDNEKLFQSKVHDLGYGRRDVSGLETADPTTYAEMLKRQMLDRVQPSTGGKMMTNDENGNPVEQSFDPTPTGQSTSFYRGNEDFQKEDDTRGRLNEYMKGIDPKNTDLINAVAGVRSGAINQAPASLYEPPPTVTPISPRGRQLPTITLPRNGRAMEMNDPPNPTTATQPVLYQIPDGKGGFVSNWLRPGQQPDATTVIKSPNGPIDKGDLPTSAAKKGIPAGLWTNLFKTNTIKSSADKQKARADAVGAINSVAIEQGMDPNIVGAVGQMLEKADRIAQRTGKQPSYEEVVGWATPDTPQEKAQMEQLLRGFFNPNGN